MHQSASEVVRLFIQEVRSGKYPEHAQKYMAPMVMAHQVYSGQAQVIERTPQNYTQHIHEFLECFGQYQFEIEEFINQGAKVYVRWRQIGHHRATILGYEATGLPIDTVGSAVYRVEDGKIIEYWIQQENEGLLAQLETNANRC
ncbi:ester cyclase [Alginatibacterium sediminis]|uniref:Ester cyclase n=1 Tax=Alginatibacterium sediminis TaxID=2164068 RepID=A0A420ENK6_9ALTE|nr:ester cyclase [Alginatibacterium sediminis]RKF22297.1 ester cyclase [Alginatibacterium sediminis]